MNSILSAEALKLKKDGSFKVIAVILICFAILMVGLTYFVSNMSDYIDINSMEYTVTDTDGTTRNATNEEKEAMFANEEMYSELLSPVSTIIEMVIVVIMCMAVFTCINTAGEFESGTIRNAISVGKNKQQYYISKVLFQLIAGTLLFILTITFCCLTHFVLFRISLFPSGQLINLIAQFFTTLLYILAYCSLFAMTAYLVRNKGAAIGIAFGFILGENILAQIFSSLPIPILNTISNFMPSILMSSIKLIGNGQLQQNQLFLMFIIPAVIIVLTNTIGILTFNKRDVN